MHISQATPVRQRLAQVAISWPLVLAVLLIGGLAGLPRVFGLNDFITTDEAYHWIERTERFHLALSERNWADTRITGHPGVTLMWLGSLGLSLERFALAQNWVSITSELEHLAWLRLPAALLQAALVPVGYLLLRRLVAPATALMAALLWATAPYLVAHARLLHLDALLTTFVTLSLLCVLIAARAEHPLRWFVGGGVLAGLALLTKGPALILLPIAGLLLFWQLPATSLLQRLRRSLSWYLLWLGVALLVVFLLWPALWVVPGRAIAKYTGEIIDNGGRPNGAGQFFLGRTVDDPGPRFYPFANLFRMTPVTLLGLLALPLALWRQAKDRQVLLALAAFVAFWTLVMTLGPKKFDRYVLPTWPALLTLAAAGWHALGRGGAAMLCWSQRSAAVQRFVATVGALMLVGVLLHPTLTYHPHYLSYYNPLLGGGVVAQRNLLIGWGEGMDAVGAYLRTRPDLDYGPVLAALPRTLRPFVPVPVKNVYELDQDTQNYAVVYLESLQRGAHPDIYAQIRQTVPLATITLHGIDYAQIHQLPRPFAQPINAQFGPALHLRGITVAHAPDQVTVIPSWDVRDNFPADYNLFLHLLNAQGQRVAHVDLPPGGAEWPLTSAWQPGQQISVPLPLPLPEELPAGEYRLVLGLYDTATGTRLPPTAGPLADPALTGPDALLLETLVFPAGE
jgi:4-amino-4-deoxy-L-arabinose transferase-like glycosyltransferase